MAKTNSTPRGFAHKPSPSAGPKKPEKPRPDFPLFPHAAGVWAKKIRGKMCYFGKWDDPAGAEAKYNAEKDALHAGRTPREDTEGVTVKVLANKYLNHKKERLDAGQLSVRTWKNYKETAELIVAEFGKGRLVADLRPDDFAALKRTMEKTKKWGPVRVRNYIQQVRSVFKYGVEAELLDRAVSFGPGFARPSRKTLRLARAEKGPRMFEADEVRALVNGKVVTDKGESSLVKPTTSLKAMVLLGVNCGFGNSDVGTLPISALDLTNGWVNYHRPKTGITRRCPLWLETVAALRAVLAERPVPLSPSDADLVFLTATGRSWHKGMLAGAIPNDERLDEKLKSVSDSPVSKEMRKLLDALGLAGNRNFYALRHTFETIGGEAKDQVAVDHIMGHARDDMASVYRERISDERLKAVSDHVRKWVFGEEKVKEKSKGKKPPKGARDEASQFPFRGLDRTE
jgi:integrase